MSSKYTTVSKLFKTKPPAAGSAAGNAPAANKGNAGRNDASDDWRRMDGLTGMGETNQGGHVFVAGRGCYAESE